MRKVIVIGSPGAGKSTFARKLCAKTGLPLCYLDSIFWRSDKTHIEADVFDARIKAETEKEAWIIDGNYLRTMPMRIEACDTVIFLDYPLEVCLEGVRSRVGHPHEDLPWTEETLDPVFYQYVRDFRDDQLVEMRRILSSCDPSKLIVFHSREESQAFIDSL